MAAFTAFPEEVCVADLVHELNGRLNHKIGRRADVVRIFVDRSGIVRLAGPWPHGTTSGLKAYVGLEFLVAADRARARPIRARRVRPQGHRPIPLAITPRRLRHRDLTSHCGICTAGQQPPARDMRDGRCIPELWPLAAPID